MLFEFGGERSRCGVAERGVRALGIVVVDPAREDRASLPAPVGPCTLHSVLAQRSDPPRWLEQRRDGMCVWKQHAALPLNLRRIGLGRTIVERADLEPPVGRLRDELLGGVDVVARRGGFAVALPLSHKTGSSPVKGEK